MGKTLNRLNTKRVLGRESVHLHLNVFVVLGGDGGQVFVQTHIMKHFAKNTFYDHTEGKIQIVPFF